MKILFKCLPVAASLLFTVNIKSQTTWSLTGNAGTTPVTNFIGTTDSQPLVVSTAGTEKARFTTTGNMGIGSTNPQRKLVVSSSGALGVEIHPFAGYGQIISYNRSTSTFSPLVLQEIAGGYVGIGNTTPLARLSVNGNALFSSITTSPTSAAYIKGNSAFSSATNPDYTWWANEQAGLFHPATNVIGLTTVGTERMRIDGAGNVGIGTTNPTAKLTVNGNVLIGDPAFVNITTPGTNYKLIVQTGILTEKVKVAIANSSDWADYVFANGYKLKTLEEVEKFVKENSHLQGVPSAMEVVKEGVDLAKMDAKLLEKIEELTLYMIDQNKKIKELEAKNNELDQALIKLREQK